MTYAEKLKDPRWQKKRLEILKRDKFTCQLCDDKGTTLHVHHIRYNGDPWVTDNKNLITYCEHCHTLIEFYKSENFMSRAVKVFKLKMGNTYILYALNRNDRGDFAVLNFDYHIESKELDLRSIAFSDMIDAINKELKIQRKKK